MPKRRNIDERDIDRLLSALTDTQIASLYGMSVIEVYRLRRSRQAKFALPKDQSGSSDGHKP